MAWERIMILSKILNFLKIPIDILVSILILPSSLILYFFRRVGGHKLKLSRFILKKIGIFPIIKNYYEPVFDFDQLKFNLNEKRNLPGINMNVSEQIELLKSLNYTNELKQLNFDKLSPVSNFNINNNFFVGGDADIYYQIIRFYKPNKIIEIGSGYSSLVAVEAINKNYREDNIKTSLVCIEPYENKWLEKKGIEVIRKKIEDVDDTVVTKLNKNDILFIDSSHIIKPQGDILKIYLEILPKLQPGVIIHIHDIFTPRDYPEKWLKEENRFYNEQYIIETLLDHSNRYKILCSLNFLKNEYFNDLKNVCPYLIKENEPGSIYLIVN